MHLGIDLFMVYAVRRWADWKNWKTYHASMVFFGALNIIYNYLASVHGRFLWKIDPAFLSQTTEEIIHSFVFFPGVALIFLSRRPTNGRNLPIYLLKWIFIFTFIEWLLFVTGTIKYAFGWSIWNSLAFDSIMFPCLLVYYQRPLIGYALFFLITGFGMWFYHIPI